jgi:hypothetical protein
LFTKFGHCQSMELMDEFREGLIQWLDMGRS